MASKRTVVPVERIESRIQVIRGQKVMRSTHLAESYAVRNGWTRGVALGLDVPTGTHASRCDPVT
jgi:hypothetical protein